jgi:peptidoglycan/xylan/chitin deacetylase (PgdA/CDA1 family)
VITRRDLRAVAGRVRDHFGSGIPVLLYHRIVSLDSDPYNICVSPEQFAEHMEIIRKRAYPVSLARLQAGLAGERLPPRAVVVTFDDGYADALYAARPVLERFDVPATVFVISSFLHRIREFWWDELEKIILRAKHLPSDLSLDVSGMTVRFQLTHARERLFRSVYKILSHLLPQEREATMQQLYDWAGARKQVRLTHRGLTPDELIRLADGGLIEIGGHTETHARLATLPPEAQKAEIAASKLTLEEVLGRPITSFAYPHGSYTPETVAIVKNTGFRCACATLGYMARRNSSVYEIPRMNIKNSGKGRLAHFFPRWL